MLGTAIAGTALSLGQTINGIIQRNKAKKELDRLEAPEITNAFEGVEISTMGSDLVKEESQRTTAGLLDTSRAGGTQTAFGLTPRIMSMSNRSNERAAQLLDDQVVKKEYAVAGDETRIQQMEENRYLNDVAGLGQAIQTGRQDTWSGVRGLGTTAMFADRNGLFGPRETAPPSQSQRSMFFDESPAGMFFDLPKLGLTDNASLYTNLYEGTT
jgi:hypothetical protein